MPSEQGNVSAQELKKIRVSLSEPNDTAALAQKGFTDCKRIHVFKCKMYLPLKTYRELQSFEDTLIGEVHEDFIILLVHLLNPFLLFALFIKIDRFSGRTCLFLH